VRCISFSTAAVASSCSFLFLHQQINVITRQQPAKLQPDTCTANRAETKAAGEKHDEQQQGDNVGKQQQQQQQVVVSSCACRRRRLAPFSSPEAYRHHAPAAWKVHSKVPTKMHSEVTHKQNSCITSRHQELAVITRQQPETFTAEFTPTCTVYGGVHTNMHSSQLGSHQHAQFTVEFTSPWRTCRTAAAWSAPPLPALLPQIAARGVLKSF
jgi:hypothetical protein